MNKLTIVSLASTLALFFVLPVLAEETTAEARVGEVYSLGVCPISGEELGGMGEPLAKVIEGREVRFCCAGCVKGFANDPSKAEALDKLIIADQSALYPSDKCINSGATLNDSAVVFVAGNREFKTCCNNCAAKVKADPASFIKKLNDAVIEKQKETYKLDKDVVTGEALKADAIDYVVANRLIRLNGDESVKAFEANPHKYIAEIDKTTK